MGKQLRNILIAVITITTLAIWTNQVALAKRRDYIFCKSLQLGMSQEEVLSSLGRFGEFNYGKSTFGTPYFELYMGYKDPKIVGQKTFILSFSDGKYTGASAIKYLDDIESVCNP